MTSDLRELGADKLILLGGLKAHCSEKLRCSEHGLNVPCELCDIEGKTRVFCAACDHQYPCAPEFADGRSCESVTQFEASGTIAFESDAQAALERESLVRAAEQEEKERAEKRAEAERRRQARENAKRKKEEAERMERSKTPPHAEEITPSETSSTLPADREAVPKEAIRKERKARWTVIAALLLGLWFLGKQTFNFLFESSVSDSATPPTQAQSQTRPQSPSLPQSQPQQLKQSPQLSGVCLSAEQCVRLMISTGRKRDFDDLEKAARGFDELEKPSIGNRNTARQLNDAALASFRERRFEEAAEKFRQSLRENARDPEVLTNLAVASSFQGAKPAYVFGLLQDALLVQPRYVPAWVVRAELSAITGASADAQAALWIAMRYASTPQKALEFFRGKVASVTEAPIVALYTDAVAMTEREIGVVSSPVGKPKSAPEAAVEKKRCTGPYSNATWTNCFGSRQIPGGDRYVGDYVGGWAEGEGTYFFADGRRYVGQYKGGSRHGLGTEYRADGSVLLQGRWENGVFLGLTRPRN